MVNDFMCVFLSMTPLKKVLSYCFSFYKGGEGDLERDVKTFETIEK